MTGELAVAFFPCRIIPENKPLFTPCSVNHLLILAKLISLKLLPSDSSIFFYISPGSK